MSSPTVVPQTAGPAAATPPPRRLLLVTGSLGEGHHAAARAVEERARQVWPGVEVVWTETLDGMGRHTPRVFRAVYSACIRRLPWLYELYLWLLWNAPPFRAGTRAIIGAWSGRGLAVALARHAPDLVVATFPEGITGLGWLRRHGRLTVPAVALIVDPAPHPLWADPALDLHLVSTEAALPLLERAAPGARVRVAGLPVAARFVPPTATEPADEPGPADRPPLAYVSFGSMAFGDLGAACSAVLDAGADVLVSCSRDAAVRRRLSRLARAHPRGERMRVVDWIEDPATATGGCDLVVTNAGGATAAEALACARPLLIFAPIAGHGRANAALLAQAGLATVCPGPAALAAAVAELMEPRCRAERQRHLRAFVAAADLAADVAALAALTAGRHVARAPRVRAQDALFLHAATPRVPQQIGARIVIEDPARRDDWPEYLAELVRRRVPQIGLLRRRLARPRPGLPLHWVDGEDVDPARHIQPRMVEIGPGGDQPSWDDAVTAFFAAPVDPVRTGWELQVARDRAAGHVAVLAKVHHALGDGLAVTDALVRLLADEESVRRAAPGAAADPAPSTVTGPRAGAVVRAAGRAATIARGVASLALAGPAGASPLTGEVTGPGHRRVSVRLDGAQVRAKARAHGVGTTVLLLAVVADTLHTLLAERRPPTAVPATVRAMVPMTTRTSAAVHSRAPGNRTAAVSIDLPTGPMPARERIAHVARAVADGSSAGQPEATAAVLNLLGLLPGRLQALAVRQVYGRRFFHLLASVMPGVRRPLHCRGGLVAEVYPVLPLADGVALAVGALNWGRTTGIGITADPGIIGEIEEIPGRIQVSLRRM
ncbi:wax ester/triacylglycerol synthase domain-containing protein [Pseudonocardia hispaniensis]|uniref:Wax ester/triacylglycerol synthase domain-containing protein n=1 Tax=Pseudonocardia hispaniensis TaxID=904933 RepID=A0ABW1J4N2_9PSEU